MPNRMKHRRVVHKSTAGIFKPIPEAVDPVDNPPQGLTNNTVALPPRGGDYRGGAGREDFFNGLRCRTHWRRNSQAHQQEPQIPHLLQVPGVIAKWAGMNLRVDSFRVEPRLSASSRDNSIATAKRSNKFDKQ